MIEQMKEWVLRVLRVPPEPLAMSSSGPLRVFRAAPGYYRYKMVLWGLQQVLTLGVLVAGLLFINLVLTAEVFRGWIGFLIRAGEAAAWAAFLVQLPLSYAVVRLDYDMRWYILSDRSLRIREGILSVQEKTMTFANIQQISIRQNPIQRLLGISDVEVRTAGGGATSGAEKGQIGESMHQAFFRGVDNAELIRSTIQDRVRRHRDAGLGDPDEPPEATDPETPAVLSAARGLRDEIRGLRMVIDAGAAGVLDA